VALETLPVLAGQLSAVLREIDAAIRARLPESPRLETARRPETDERAEGRRGVVAAALRWLTRSAEPASMPRRARSPREGSQGRATRRRGA
jgi:hypothetical protein